MDEQHEQRTFFPQNLHIKMEDELTIWDHLKFIFNKFYTTIWTDKVQHSFTSHRFLSIHSPLHTSTSVHSFNYLILSPQ